MVKRSRKPARTCKFCGAGLEGRPKKTIFCTASCRARYWRRDRIASERYEQVCKHIDRLAECLAYPATHVMADNLLGLLPDKINFYLMNGYQRKLPGVEQ